MKLAEELTKKEIEEYIDEYKRSWKEKDKKTFANIHSELFKNRFLNKEQLFEVAYWKTHRKSKIVKKEENNPDEIVKDVTELALKITNDEYNEKYKIRILCTLDGIGIPRASTILTMDNPDEYGIIDFYAWLALTGKEKIVFNENDWIKYLKQIKGLAKKHGKTPRQIDMALMKYGQRLNSESKSVSSNIAKR
jgi:hypothetical protein